MNLANMKTSSRGRQEEKIDYLKSLPFFGVHLTCLAAFLTGISWNAVILCITLYVVRMFGITAGYHRYLSHKSYRTSRIFQFFLSWLGCSAVQKGPLWWASHHRRHHQYSDQEEDIHSPMRKGFWWAHVGWFLCDKYADTDMEVVKDLAVYPELRWLNRYHVLPGVVLATACLLLGGWQTLIWGFFISTVLLYHGTFFINSLCHLIGKRRYETSDTSRNSFILAFITLGEGWHNNHHHYATTANQGFFWWELDVTYYLLRLLGLVGVVWELKRPPLRFLSPAKA
jgi:stearoyl-CoA desaturase (delta-9 desaturase)